MFLPLSQYAIMAENEKYYFADKKGVSRQQLLLQNFGSPFVDALIIHLQIFFNSTSFHV